jgi:UDP-N-acetylmuramyl pentapeptide phosphotransferase/UDP-N-acetylglucosamine-1-phosphate transferase
VFCFFNFRTKAKCFSGDVGSIGMALMLVFLVGRLMLKTGDFSWILLYVVYCVDGCLTVVHRTMLHEKVWQAHRKHAYQLMANELKIPHVVVSSFYSILQLVISLIAIYVIPDNLVAHWIYLGGLLVVLNLSYFLFMKKYYHLHEDYLRSLHTEE